MKRFATIIMTVWIATLSALSAIALDSDSIAMMPTDMILDRASHLDENGMFGESSSALESLSRLGRDLTATQRVRLSYGLAHAYYGMGVYSRAINHVFEVLNLDPDGSLARFDVGARLILADIYVRFRAPDRAANVLKKALARLEKADMSKIERDNMLQRIHQQWSSVHGARGEWNEFLKSLALADSLGEHTSADRLRRQLDYAIYYSQTGDYRLSGRYFERVINSPGWSYDKMAAYCDYAQLLLVLGDYRRALSVADDGLAALEGHGNDEMRAELMHVRGVALNSLGNPAEAVECLEKSRQLNDSILRWHSSQSVLQACRDYELDLEAKSKIAAEKQRRRQAMTIRIIAAVALLILGLAIFLWRRQVRSRRDVHSLELLMAEQQDTHRRRLSDTMGDLDRKRRNLMSLTLKLAQLNEVIERAVGDNSSGDAAGRLDTLRSEIRRIGLNRNVWDIFDVLCEQTSPDFFKRLTQLHPDLTRGETRMCAYIFMNLGTKEIATMTNRSTRTVETVKYRLNKKLAPPDGMSLGDYLRSLDIPAPTT